MIYLQTADDLNVWEQVDDYTAKHCKEALNDAGTGPRYTDNFLVKTESGLRIVAQGLTDNHLAIVARFLGIKIDTGAYPGGNLRKPNFVKFRNRQGGVVLRTANGDIFRKASGRKD